jgi:tRNA-specific 2-thiouridylase
VAAKLGIKLLRLDFTKEYKKKVLDYMYREYKAGRTPNPDVLCNKHIKFGVWLDWALKNKYDYLATGHYSKSIKSVKLKVHKVRLMCAKDNDKDQTYFLHQLNQKQLQHVIFPIGDYLKSEVRQLARRFKLPTAEKEESMGICFIGEVPMKEFLQKKIKVKKGDVILNDEIIDEHDGLSFYTIGQRINAQVKNEKLKVKSCDTKPLYVIGKNISKNQLIVGCENDSLLYKSESIVKNVNWIAGREPKFPLKCKVRLRHRQPLQDCVIIKALKHKSIKIVSGRFAKPIINNTQYTIHFAKSQRAVTPGQFAVFYTDERLYGGAHRAKTCLGGGVIK